MPSRETAIPVALAQDITDFTDYSTVSVLAFSACTPLKSGLRCACVARNCDTTRSCWRGTLVETLLEPGEEVSPGFSSSDASSTIAGTSVSSVLEPITCPRWHRCAPTQNTGKAISNAPEYKLACDNYRSIQRPPLTTPRTLVSWDSGTLASGVHAK